MSQNDTKSVPPLTPVAGEFKPEWLSAVRSLGQIFPQLDLRRPLVEQVDSLTLFEVISSWENQVGQLDDACIDWMARRGVSDQDMAD
jgi:hypothetical protein